MTSLTTAAGDGPKTINVFFYGFKSCVPTCISCGRCEIQVNISVQTPYHPPHHRTDFGTRFQSWFIVGTRLTDEYTNVCILAVYTHSTYGVTHAGHTQRSLLFERTHGEQPTKGRGRRSGSRTDFCRRTRMFTRGGGAQGVSIRPLFLSSGRMIYREFCVAERAL